MNRFDISSKVILVTGASQGIGFALARGYAQEGALVYLNGRKAAKLDQAIEQLKQEGLEARPAVFDVADEEAVQAGISQILEDAGKIDILVNNAGIIIRDKLENLSLEDWNTVVRTNLTGPFLVSKYVAPGMIEAGGGKIINICSLMSELGRDTVGAYAAAKGGLKMLTQNMATEWGRHNIQANGIGPGYIATPINAVYRAPGNPLNEYIISRTPAGRWGKTEDLVGAAIFLASPASDFVNGQILYVDGGVMATFGNPEQSS